MFLQMYFLLTLCCTLTLCQQDSNSLLHHKSAAGLSSADELEINNSELLDLVDAELARRQSSSVQNIISRPPPETPGRTSRYYPTTNYRIASRQLTQTDQTDLLSEHDSDQKATLLELLQLIDYLNRGYQYDQYTRMKHPRERQLPTQPSEKQRGENFYNIISANKRESGHSGLFTYWKAGLQNQNQRNRPPQYQSI